MIDYMESLIQELVKLDKKAASITLSAESSLQKLDETISEKSSAAVNTINNALNNKLDEINNEVQQKIAAEKNRIRENTNEKINNMKAYYESNSEAWVEDIFNRITDTHH